MALVLAAFCAGLMAKATLVTVPVLLLLVDVWPLDRWAADGAERDSTARAHRRYPQQPTSALLLEKLPLFLVATLMAAGTLLAQRRAITDEAALPLLSVRIPNAVHAVGWYLWKTAFPTQLAALYRHPGGQGWPLFDLVSSGAAIALVVVVAWSIRRAVPAAAIGVGWFLIAVSPVIGIVAQVGQQAHADRYSYVPHIGLFWALTWTGSKLIRQRWLPPAAVAAGCVALIGVYATLDRLQIAVGRDSQPLWQRVLTLDPENTTACNNLGVALYEAGRPSEATRGDEVVGIFHLGHGTPGIAADHQGPECVGALPDRNLPERRGGKDRDGGDDPASLPRVGHALAVCDIGDEPDRGENEANVGHIGEPVGMPLKSRLGHDAEHRQQGHAEPGKPHRQRRLPPGRNGDHDTPCDRNETAAGDRGGREFARRMPVERLEPRRPDGRRDISDECMEGIGQPRGH